MSLIDIETKARLEDAETQLEIERNLRDKAEQEQENAQLKARIAELEKERNQAHSIIVEARAKVEQMDANIGIYHAQAQSDLQAARTDAELAATHREELEQLVI